MPVFVAVILMTCAMVFSPVQAAGYRLEHKFQRDDPQPGDLFGTSVVLEAGVAVIKSDSAYGDGDGRSVTHIFELGAGEDWNETATLEFDSGDNTGNWFIGQELAIDKGQLVIGYGPYSNFQDVRPLQFAERLDGEWPITFGQPPSWSGRPRDPARPPGYQSQHLAGRSVDISGSLAVGVDRFFMPRGEIGLARLWRREADGVWGEAEYLTIPNDTDCSSISDCTASLTVSLDKHTAVVSTRSYSDSRPRVQGVHFFERQSMGGWIPTEQFMAPEDVRSFGIVELDGDIAINRDINSGAIQTYERRAGVWEEGFGYSAAEASCEFGVSHVLGLAVEGDQFAFAAGTGVVEDPYRVEVYRRESFGQWSLFTTIHDPEPSLNDYFGASLDFDQGRLLIGTQAATGPPAIERDSLSPGSAYLFVPVPEPATATLGAILVSICIIWSSARNRTACVFAN